MDWLSLEGIQRVKVSYKVWKHSVRTLRHAKHHASRKTIHYLKEDVQNEYDELVDAILSLTHNEFLELQRSIRHNRLYDLMCTLESC